MSGDERRPQGGSGGRQHETDLIVYTRTDEIPDVLRDARWDRWWGRQFPEFDALRIARAVAQVDRAVRGWKGAA